MKKLFTFIFFSLFVNVMVSQTMTKMSASETKATISKISEKQNKIKAIEADFTQKKKTKLLNSEMVSKGILVYSVANDYMKWEYKTPYFYSFEMKGDRISVSQGKGKKREDVPSTAMFQGLSSFLSCSINGKGLNDTKNFDISLYKSGSEYIADMLPKKSRIKKVLKKMQMFFDKRSYMVNKVVISSVNGDTTTILFSNMKTK